MTSNWLKNESVMTVLFLLFIFLKIFLIECFYIQNFEVETSWHKNKQNKERNKQ